MKRDNAAMNLVGKYSHRIYKLRMKIRDKAPPIIQSVLGEMDKRRHRASRLSNVYYLDYDRAKDTMYWMGLNDKDPKDRRNLKALYAYLEGEEDIYHEMRLSKLPETIGYLRWSVREKRAGYVRDAHKSVSVNRKLDEKLGYRSCIHIPLCKDYRLAGIQKGGIGNVIGDIILAHPDLDGILENVPEHKRRRAIDRIAYSIYHTCNLKDKYDKLNAGRDWIRPLRNRVQKEFSYFFDTNLEREYLRAVKRFTSRVHRQAENEPLMRFLCLLPNMLYAAKGATISMDEMVDKLYSEATPLVDWIRRLKEGEKVYSADGSYREHLRHIITVYMLGITVLASGYDRFVQECFEKHLKRLASKQTWTPDALVWSMWTVVAFSHDALYALTKTPEAVGTLIDSFGHTGKRIAGKSSGANKPTTVLCPPELLANLLPVAKHLADMEVLAQSPAKGTEAPCDRIIQTLSGLIARRDKHDTLAGIALEVALRDVESSSSSTRLWRQVAQKLMVDRTRYYKNVITAAVGYHHGSTEDIKLPVPTEDFQMPQLWLEMHPLLVLLVLCDGIHNWGREMKDKYVNQIIFNSVHFREGEMTFRLDLDCDKDEAKAILDGYRKHLAKPFKRAFSSRRQWKIELSLSNRSWPKDRFVCLMS